MQTFTCKIYVQITFIEEFPEGSEFEVHRKIVPLSSATRGPKVKLVIDPPSSLTLDTRSVTVPNELLLGLYSCKILEDDSP